MEYAKLGNSGLSVSRLCAGCMSFGDPASNMHAWTLNPKESETLIKRALDLGLISLIPQMSIQMELVRNISDVPLEIMWLVIR